MGQLNKGHSNFSTSETQVSNIVKSHKLDLCTISEANLKQNDLTTHNTFEGYNIESQFMKGATESRLVVVIKKGIHYERLYHLERDYISMMWFKVRITRSTYLIIIGCVYRQWQLPQEVDPLRGGSTKEQCDRFQIIMNMMDIACQYGHNTVFCGDVNIDIHPPNDPLSRYELRMLTETYESHLRKNHMSQINFEPTRHWPGRGSTLLDHFQSTCPEKFNNIQNIRSHIADHDLVKANVHVIDLFRKPQYKRYRKYNNVNYTNIMTLIEANPMLQKIFNFKCPHKIAKTIVEAYNSILNFLAPTITEEIKYDDKKFEDMEVHNLRKEADSTLTEAISSKNPEKWRIYKYLRNKYSKAISKLKSAYYSKLFQKDYNIWKHISNKGGSTPSEIISQGKRITSPAKIADRMNNYFYEKGEKIVLKAIETFH